MQSRREYIATMQRRYAACKTREEKSQLVDEVVKTLGYHRKYAIRRLNAASPLPSQPIRRKRAKQYQDALPAIQKVWEALDYCCAERLHPVLLPTAEHLAAHGELYLDDTLREQLSRISRTTLGRRLAEMRSPKARRVFCEPKAMGRLRREVPIDSYAWDEGRAGALEIDLVEHNGGRSLGQFAYTLNVVDVVTFYSRRAAVPNRGQRAVFQALEGILNEWPCPVWGLHTDNGSEFLNGQLVDFARTRGLAFTRSRPYRKNDSPHVEQKNLQWVRAIIGYERYEGPQDVQWLNSVYAVLDPYVNLFVPSRKVIAKARSGHRVRKTYDTAQTPFQRMIALGVLTSERLSLLQRQYRDTNPLQLHRRLERILSLGPHQEVVAISH